MSLFSSVVQFFKIFVCIVSASEASRGIYFWVLLVTLNFYEDEKYIFHFTLRLVWPCVVAIFKLTTRQVFNYDWRAFWLDLMGNNIFLHMSESVTSVNSWVKTKLIADNAEIAFIFLESFLTLFMSQKWPWLLKCCHPTQAKLKRRQPMRSESGSGRPIKMQDFLSL